MWVLVVRHFYELIEHTQARPRGPVLIPVLIEEVTTVPGKTTCVLSFQVPVVHVARLQNYKKLRENMASQNENDMISFRERKRTSYSHETPRKKKL